jgi:hypothetical protein
MTHLRFNNDTYAWRCVYDSTVPVPDDAHVKLYMNESTSLCKIHASLTIKFYSGAIFTVEMCTHEWVNDVIINRIFDATKAYRLEYSESPPTNVDINIKCHVRLRRARA